MRSLHATAVKFGLGVLCLALTAVSSAAPEKTFAWKAVGLKGTDVLEFVEHAAAKTLYARTGKGLFARVNGAEWAPVDLGTPGTVTSLVVSPSGVAYVTLRENALLRKNDAGKWERILWEDIDPLQFEAAGFLGKALVVSATQSILTGHEMSREVGEFYSSEDEGETWKLQQIAVPPARQWLAVEGGAVLIPKQFHQLLFFKADGSKVATNLRVPIGGFTSVVVDKKKRAVFAGGAVTATSDLGKSWQEIIPLPKTTPGQPHLSTMGITTPSKYTVFADQKGELFLGLDPSANQIDKQTLFSVNLENNQRTYLGCSKSSGCSAAYRRITSVYSPGDGKTWVGTDNGIYEVKEKRPFRLEIVLNEGGRVQAFNRENGAAFRLNETTALEGLNSWNEGEAIELTAIPNRGFSFAGWKSAACAKADEARCSFVLNADTVVEATFKPAP